ncbi:ABC transporter permease [Bacillus infantis]|uniref:ABC transporter permease n=1 Tax=Bacillus infantis TaxID=324767 RepID=UPI000B9B2E5F|nr:ABC transporter permease [Bacillus infantis]MCK6206830.1 ABC transporter permease [Bacillus infantis]OXT18003.1 bacitracin ABC transporter permease [Bacillus sp. OG2]
MSVNQLIWKNLKKNVKNYYLYIFALIFSAALYFAFVTLQYDPAMDEIEGSIKGGAGMKAASVLLVAIVAVFLVYANSLFTKRRSREIGLFQLIGMTKSRIFRILTAENFMLYYGSLLIGMMAGFLVSKLMMMILFKITGVDEVAELYFSNKALVQTLIVFTAIYLLIMLVNYLFIKGQSILSLFRVQSSAEEKIRKMSFFNIIIGILGIILIAAGYYVSGILFEGDFTSMPELFGAMIFILGAVILGTYFFYKGSVSFIIYLIRKKKDGYLNVKEVLSLSSIMFRMKSNALLLTIITTVSALAIGLLSLSYISYYSAEKMARDNVPNDFSFTVEDSAVRFRQVLDSKNIDYREKRIEVVTASIDVKDIQGKKLEEMNFDTDKMDLPVISESSAGRKDLDENEAIFTGYSDVLQRFMPLKDSGKVKLHTKEKEIPLNYIGLEKDYLIPLYYTRGGLQTAIVDDAVFEQLKAEKDPGLQAENNVYIGIDIKDPERLNDANEAFHALQLGESGENDSQLDVMISQKSNMGLIMFIVGFLGLSFLVTSGCILYFKQMGESEDEKPNFTILRKLGFTTGDLMKGLQAKQLFSFGIPLAIGLVHSYFAVQSGWFMFGAEVWTPMISVMILYTILYSIFGILSVLYSKKVVKDAL